MNDQTLSRIIDLERRLEAVERNNAAGDTLATDLVTEVDNLRARLAAYEKAEGELPSIPVFDSIKYLDAYGWGCAIASVAGKLRTIAAKAIAEQDRLREELEQEKAFNMECQTLPLATARQEGAREERARIINLLNAPISRGGVRFALVHWDGMAAGKCANPVEVREALEGEEKP